MVLITLLLILLRHQMRIGQVKLLHTSTGLHGAHDQCDGTLFAGAIIVHFVTPFATHSGTGEQIVQLQTAGEIHKTHRGQLGETGGRLALLGVIVIVGLQPMDW